MTDRYESTQPQDIGAPAAEERLGATIDYQPSTTREPVVLAETLPRRFGDYELLEVLGRGGMGVVYKARQLSLDRIVAVKMILSGRLASRVDVQRFYLEARTAGKLSHPNIVTVYEIDELEGNHFYSMDYIEGSNLAGLVRDGPLDSVRAARYVKLIAEAIHVAHENGVLHRDLKPQNVLVDSHDQPHITDFGLAKQLGGESGLTVSGAAVGTPSYMPPEQASGRHAEVTRASDVYSLGAILYALLTAQAPFRNDSVLETITDVIHKEPTPPRTINPKADRDLETICLTCLQKKAARRYPTAGELADDLGRYLNGEPIRAKPIGPLTRAWHWIRHIPLVAAMTGSRHGLPTPWQRRAGWALLLLPWLLGLAILGWRFRPETLPVRMRIASAAPGGLYHEFAQALGQQWQAECGRRAEVLTTGGSVQNAELLATRQAEVALLQENAITAQAVAVAAPLYYDVVHFVVRKNRGITCLQDLAGKRVSLGAVGSGMRLNAVQILELTGVIDPRLLPGSDQHFTALASDKDLDAALVTTGCHSADLRRVLADEAFELLPLDESLIETLSLRHPGFRSYVLRRGSIREAAGDSPAIPVQDVRTVATTTFLAVRRDARLRLVTTLLRSLYRDPRFLRDFDVLSPTDAARWKEFALHPAALRFFAKYRDEP